MGKHKHRSPSPKHRHRSKSPSRLDYRELDAAIFGIEPPRKHKKKKSKSRSPEISRRRQKSRDRSRSRDRKKKEPRSSSSDSDSQDDKKKKKPPRTAEEHLAAIQRMKEAKKMEKEKMKAMETPEQKRARRLAKKEAKELKRKKQSGWDEEYMGYSNVDNPFGDPNLLDTFVWSKKHEAGGMGQPEMLLHSMQKKKQEETRNELEKVKRRRQEREREREEREREMEMIQRDKESEYYKEWEKQEDRFHLEQALLRSKIRIQNGRAKPIDLLAKYISAEQDELAIEMHEPYTYLNGLTINDLEDLVEDIKVYLELHIANQESYWKDITIICEEELAKLKRLDPTYHKRESNRREGINQAVSQDVSVVFKGKTYSQLQLLEKSIKEKLKGGEGIDVGYWESLLSQLRAFMARARLRERHQEVLKQKLAQLKEEQGVEGGGVLALAAGGAEVATPSKEETPETEGGKGETSKDEESEKPEEPDDEEVVLSMEDLEEAAYNDYEAGSYTPPRINDPDKMLELQAYVITEEDDQKKLEMARGKMRATGSGRLDSTEDTLMKKAMEGMNDDDWNFGSEMSVDNKTYMWSDKYRPRKPRYFNRVHTGFEWNKYNQTHYDYDNPPPKIVQGYKFNIFYPDLIDKTATPQYTITPIPDTTDFATLRFAAGPPYEDIAFKIVSREWEYSYKHGFKCQFQNGIFQLWFHFKRYRYRR